MFIIFFKIYITKTNKYLLLTNCCWLIRNTEPSPTEKHHPTDLIMSIVALFQIKVDHALTCSCVAHDCSSWYCEKLWNHRPLIIRHVSFRWRRRSRATAASRVALNKWTLPTFFIYLLSSFLVSDLVLVFFFFFFQFVLFRFSFLLWLILFKEWFISWIIISKFIILPCSVIILFLKNCTLNIFLYFCELHTYPISLLFGTCMISKFAY